MSGANFFYLLLFILLGISCKPRKTIYAESNLTKTKNEITIFVDSSVFMPSHFWGNKLPKTDFLYYNFNTFSINTLTLKNGFVKLYNNNPFLLFETKTNIPHLIIPNEKYVLLFDNETGNFNIKSNNRTIQKKLDFFYKLYNLTDSINNVFNKKNYKNYNLQFFDSTINKERLIDLYNKIKLDNSLLELEKEKLINIINHDKSQYSKTVFSNVIRSQTLKNILHWITSNRIVLQEKSLYTYYLQNFIDNYINVLSEDEVVFNASFLESLLHFECDPPIKNKSHCSNLSDAKGYLNYTNALKYFKGDALNFLLTSCMYKSIENDWRTVISKRTEYFDIVTNKEMKARIAQKFNQYSKAKPIVISKNIEDFYGDRVEDIQTVINSNRGTLILLDFWASWCAPCREESSYFNKLKISFNNEDIEFINISSDKNAQQWKLAVIADNFDKKNNYRVLNEIDPFLINNSITFFPRYMLIGKDGNIISADAPRPSDPALKELIEKNL